MNKIMIIMGFVGIIGLNKYGLDDLMLILVLYMSSWLFFTGLLREIDRIINNK